MKEYLKPAIESHTPDLPLGEVVAASVAEPFEPPDDEIEE